MSLTKSSANFDRMMEENRHRDHVTYEDYREYADHMARTEKQTTNQPKGNKTKDKE